MPEIVLKYVPTPFAHIRPWEDVVHDRFTTTDLLGIFVLDGWHICLPLLLCPLIPAQVAFILVMLLKDADVCPDRGVPQSFQGVARAQTQTLDSALGPCPIPC